MDRDLGSTPFVKHSNLFTGNYRGEVLDNNDPNKTGRIKVRVYPMMVGEDLTEDCIPWAIPAMPLWNGSSSGQGFLAVPKVGSYVWVFFEQGDIYQPVYFAEAPDPTRGIPTLSAINYPNRKVATSSGGITFVVDDTDDFAMVTTFNDLTVLIDNKNKLIGFYSKEGLEVSLDDVAKKLKFKYGPGSIEIDSSGNVVVEGTTVSINP